MVIGMSLCEHVLFNPHSGVAEMGVHLHVQWSDSEPTDGGSAAWYSASKPTSTTLQLHYPVSNNLNYI